MEFFPTPNVRTLQAAFGAGSTPNSLEPWKGRGRGGAVREFHRARWALGEAARLLFDGGDGTLWIPDYICGEAEVGARALGLSIRYYRIDEDLRPDPDSLSGAVPGDVMVYVHYFGFSPGLREARDLTSSKGVHLLEDAAHCLHATGRVGASGDAVIYSPRKLLPLGGGGLLWTPGMTGDSDSEGDLPQDHLDTVVFIAGMARGGMNSAGVPYRRLRDKILGFPSLGNQSGHGKDPDSEVRRAMGAISRRLVRNVGRKELDRIGALRRENYGVLARALSDDARLDLVFPEVYEGTVPYAVAVKSGNRDALMMKLRRAGIPAQAWPTLPRAVAEDEAGGKARDLANSMLLLPIHQDLERPDLKRIAGVISA